MRVANATTPTAATAPTQRSTDPSSLDKSAFLQLLVAQLRNQDPLNPMDNQQFVTQLAQLHSLVQTETLVQSTELQMEMEVVSQSMALLGRQVEYRTGQDEQTASGTVQGVQISSGMPILIVDGNEVAPGDVVGVKLA